jgi:hypothetical protein
MPLPEKVIEQLGKDSPKTPGWSVGLVSFSGGILFITLIVWAGLQFGYKPYFDAQTQKIEDQINAENQAISPTDQTDLIDYYSQLANIRQLLNTHVIPTNIFAWLEANTEQNVYYSSFSLANNGQVTLTANALTEGDANQQIAIFENSPQVQNMVVSGISLGSSGGFWQFSVTMTINPALIASSTQPTS